MKFTDNGYRIVITKVVNGKETAFKNPNNAIWLDIEDVMFAKKQNLMISRAIELFENS